METGDQEGRRPPEGPGLAQVLRAVLYGSLAVTAFMMGRVGLPWTVPPQDYLTWIGWESFGGSPRWAVLLWTVVPAWMAVSLGRATQHGWEEDAGWSPGVVMLALFTFVLMLLSIGVFAYGLFHA